MMSESSSSPQRTTEGMGSEVTELSAWTGITNYPPPLPTMGPEYNVPVGSDSSLWDLTHPMGPDL